MSEQEKSTQEYSSAFSGDLANILYGTPADPDRDAQEVKIVQRMEQWIMTASKKKLWMAALYIDDEIVPLLSGKNLLQLARLIESRAEVVISQMRRLRTHREHLEVAAEMAEILSPKNMERLIAAFKAASADDKK